MEKKSKQMPIMISIIEVTKGRKSEIHEYN